MAFGVKHKHQTLIPDDPNRDVSADEWNDVHAIDTLLVLPAQVTDPDTPEEGSIWYNAADGQVKVFAGGDVTPIVSLIDGDVKSNLTPAQSGQVGTGIDHILPSEAQIILAAEHLDANIQPTVYVANTIVDSTGTAFATKVAGIYSYIEQTGLNTQQYLKSICGVSVNAAGGNNDSTAVVGYSYKLDVPAIGAYPAGIGDVCGSGGASWQYSHQEGLVLGAEFSSHQGVPGTFASDFAKSGNNTMAVHVSTNSSGARAFVGIALDTFGTNAGHFGFWNAILVSRSCFMEDGAGEGIAGTVGLNFGNNTIAWADQVIRFGNGNHHLYRGNAAIRVHASTFDFENLLGGTPGIRLASPRDNPQGGYFGAYKGATGPDGATAVTPMGSLSISPDRYVSLQAYDDAGNMVTKVGASGATNAFLPLIDTGTTGLGAPSRLWSQLFAATSTISTSDERFKTDIQDIPDVVLDAWGEVNFSQYRFTDAVSKKGQAARLHVGVIVQRVMEAFEWYGIDPMAYGLVCYDEWEAEPDTTTTEKVVVKHAVYEQVLQKAAVHDQSGREISGDRWIDGELLTPEVVQEIVTTTPGIKAGNRYGIRYEEALCMEAAYQRRRADRVEARLAALEARLGVAS